MQNNRVDLHSKLYKLMELIVNIKNVWGNYLIYPVNDTANKFANLLGKKTFNNFDLTRIEALGYKITQN